ncbi:hypothetical protein [Paraburkholderia strydomiana]|uniref:Uncharacterized protein n=1 Tax=Paraburkholderia strydomiana TaxID=1245417 RepID=A0ABW9BYA0_9BURK
MPEDTWNALLNKAKSFCFKGMPQATQLMFDDFSGRRTQDTEIREGEHYFGVTLKGFGLRYGQEFHIKYDPLVLLTVDFQHGSQRVTVPRLIGPSALAAMTDNGDKKLPHGFSMRNIRIIGPHPYRGEQVGISVVLYKVERTNYAKRALAFAEKLSGAIGFPADISVAFKIGDSIVDALEVLFDMKDNVPLIGCRFELNASPMDGFQPQQFALVNSNESSLSSLDVKNGELVHPSGEPVSDLDYVLFDLWRADARGSEAGLVPEDMAKRLRDCALAGDDESWRRGKSLLITLYQELVSNPDLTDADAERLFERYAQLMLRDREHSKCVGLMSEKQTGDAFAESEARKRARLNDKSREIFALAV